MEIIVTFYPSAPPLHPCLTKLGPEETGWIRKGHCRPPQAQSNITTDTGTMPDVVSSLDQLNTTSSIWSIASDLVKAFFSLPIKTEDQKQFTFRRKWQYTLTVLFQGHIKSKEIQICWTSTVHHIDPLHWLHYIDWVRWARGG